MLTLCLGLLLVQVASTTDPSRIRGAFFGAVVADALSLSTHYEYDAKRIRQFYGHIDRFFAPGEKTGGTTHGIGWGARNYHGGNGRGAAKKAGENTDYGDYNLLVLEHLAAETQASNAEPPRLDLATFIPRWQERMQTWRAWMCTMSRQSLQQVAQGVPFSQLGGHSNAMAIRHAAAYAFYRSEDDIVHAARASMFTHRNAEALDGGEFFARVTFRIIHEHVTPRRAITAVAKQSSPFIQRKVKQAFAKFDEATDPQSPLSKEDYVDDLALTSMARLWDVGKTEPIKVGKASPTEGTLPGSVYLILKYSEGDYANPYQAAVQANAEVGGDCASRAIAIGMVLGAHQGMAAVPELWGSGHYVEWERAMTLLDRGPLLQAPDQAAQAHAEL